MRICWSDTETYSEVPIACGTHAYAEKAEVMLWAFAIDDGPVEVWDLTAGGPMPTPLAAALADPDCVFAFYNSHFDRTVLRHCGFQIPVHRVRDPMVKALAHSLPGGLDKLCGIFQIPVDKAKAKDGRRLVLLFCKPRPAKSNPRRATRETHPAEWAKFVEYARRDVEAMRAIDAKLPTWNCSASERALWELDQTINDRGFAVDVDLARAAIAAVQVEQARLSDRTQVLTGGDVQAATQRDEMLRHITRAYGITLPDMQQSTLERRISDPDLPAALRELLAIRLEASATSTAKYQTLVRACSSDGRLRGSLQFCGAARTGRWAGRLFQPQNLPRATLKQNEIDAGIAALKAGCADLLFRPLVRLIGSALRGAIVAPAGRKLVAADLANIEGRGLAWLAGEEWKLEAFREFDAGTGPDLYKLAYARSFGIPAEDVTKEQRQIGKVQELALGYEGGVGAFVTFAAAYGIDLEAMAEQAFSAIPADILDEARSALEWTKREGRPTFGLSAMAWTVCDAFKRAWRYGHPATASFWRDLQDAARIAVQNPGRAFDCRRVRLRRDGAWLRIRLPSGRYLCYPGIRLGEGNKLSYMGVNQYSRQWERIETYGGKLCLAIGTLVLSRRGWTPIENINAADEVWDGVEWVRTRGAKYNGAKIVQRAFGAWMTPDHLVLTDKGWRHASQSTRHNRAGCRLPEGYGIPRRRERQVGVERDVRLRGDGADIRFATTEASKSRGDGLVRLYAARNDREQAHNPRNEQPPRFSRLALDAGAVLQPEKQGVEKLRREGHRGLRALAHRLQRLLDGHGARLCPWVVTRQDRQQRGLFASKLPVGNGCRASEQHPREQDCRRQDCGATGGHPRSKTVHDVLPPIPGGAGRPAWGDARFVAPVFDLVNCGPRSRFVILAGEAPLIVHNCENITQAVARDVMADSMPRVEAAGYRLVLSEHDELIAETPDTPEYNAAHLSALMATPPEWADGLPLAAEGFEAARYRK